MLSCKTHVCRFGQLSCPSLSLSLEYLSGNVSLHQFFPSIRSVGDGDCRNIWLQSTPEITFKPDICLSSGTWNASQTSEDSCLGLTKSVYCHYAHMAQHNNPIILVKKKAVNFTPQLAPANKWKYFNWHRNIVLRAVLEASMAFSSWKNGKPSLTRRWSSHRWWNILPLSHHQVSTFV